jgi:DNA helicase-2/ATP-dependent DNA helicase PcrA
MRPIAGRVVPAAPVPDFALGARVFHEKFGYGTVNAVEGDKLTVAFDKSDIKKVIASFLKPAA